MQLTLVALTLALAVVLPAYGAEEPAASPYPTSVSTAGPCPLAGPTPCTIVLAGPGAPSASAACSTGPVTKLLRFTQPGRWSDSNGDGSWETVLEIALDPARSCGCARIRTFYGESLSGWTLHVGNSPTNNGHGGDEGTTDRAAELQVAKNTITVFTAAMFEHRQIERLLDLSLPVLAGRILEVEVCDQTLTVTVSRTRDDPDPLRWRLETVSSKLLFSLGSGSTAGPAPIEVGAVYVGLNRVVHALSGAASHGRIGSGVQRVEIELSP